MLPHPTPTAPAVLMPARHTTPHPDYKIGAPREILEKDELLVAVDTYRPRSLVPRKGLDAYSGP